jgi:MoaA/NifB/PqqE/SkfB family radical SAM enzyme
VNDVYNRIDALRAPLFISWQLTRDCDLCRLHDLASSLGCSAFVTGPMMRIGRAAAQWDSISCSDTSWERAVDDLRAHAASTVAGTVLSIYPWDIVTEMERRLTNPQAMLLVVPNGKVKLLNALPFAPADLRRQSLEDAWNAYRHAWRAPEVRQFITDCRGNLGLLQHANETWSMAHR